jgi:hypothetical protein
MNHFKKLLKIVIKNIIQLTEELKEESVVDPKPISFKVEKEIESEEEDSAIEPIARVVQWAEKVIDEHAKSDDKQRHLNAIALMEEFGPWVDDDIDDIEYTSISKIEGGTVE